MCHTNYGAPLLKTVDRFLHFRLRLKAAVASSKIRIGACRTNARAIALQLSLFI
jgi:hypothetical protein